MQNGRNKKIKKALIKQQWQFWDGCHGVAESLAPEVMLCSAVVASF